MNDAVLVTGATGFAGSFLVDHYARAGYTVHGTYRTPPETVAGADVRMHQLELRDRSATARLVADIRPGVVIHLAGQSSVAVSLRDPLGTLRSNLEAQFSVLEAVRAHAPASRVVVVGSCDEYGNVAPTDNPVTEDQALLPVNPYALSKVGQDLMGYQFWAQYGLNVVRVRPFLQIGPRRADHFVAGSFARQVAEIKLGLRAPVVDVGRLDLVRDFTDVRDVVRAYAAVAESGETGEVYNIASGKGRSLRDLLEAMLCSAAISAEPRQDPARLRTAEMPSLVGDARRLLQRTGWRPGISFEQSAADTVAYWIGRLRAQTAMQKERV